MARDLFKDAQAMLKDLIDNKRLKAQGVVGFWPAAQQNLNDVALFEDESREQQIARFCFLRQQSAKANGVPNLSLADYVAPQDAGTPDSL